MRPFSRHNNFQTSKGSQFYFTAKFCKFSNFISFLFKLNEAKHDSSFRKSVKTDPKDVMGLIATTSYQIAIIIFLFINAP